MVAVFDFILDFIRVDLIIGFGWYSILFFIFRLFKYQKELLTEFDKNACKTLIFLGILFAIIWLTLVTFTYFGIMNEEEKTQFIRRLTGQYSFGYWLQPLFWLILTQLVRLHFVRRFLIFRLLNTFLSVYFFKISLKRFYEEFYILISKKISLVK